MSLCKDFHPFVGAGPTGSSNCWLVKNQARKSGKKTFHVPGNDFHLSEITYQVKIANTRHQKGYAREDEEFIHVPQANVKILV